MTNQDEDERAIRTIRAARVFDQTDEEAAVECQKTLARLVNEVIPSLVERKLTSVLFIAIDTEGNGSLDMSGAGDVELALEAAQATYDEAFDA